MPSTNTGPFLAIQKVTKVMSVRQSYFVLSCSLYQVNYTRRKLLLSLIEDCRQLNIIILAVVYKHGDTPIISEKVYYIIYQNVVILYLKTFFSIVKQGKSCSTIITFSPIMNIFGFIMSFVGYKHVAVISGLGRFGFFPLRFLFKALVLIGSKSRFVLMNQHDLDFVRSVNKSICYQLILSEGINSSLFHQVNCAQKSPKPKILFIARLLRSKGILSFLEFFRATHEFDFDFIILGEGSPSIEKYLEKLQCFHENLTYYKRVSEEQKYSLLNQSTHFYYQSHYYEGAPLTLLEAQVFNLVPIYLDSRIGSSLLYEQESDHHLSILEPHTIVSYILRTMPKSFDKVRQKRLSDLIFYDHDRILISSQIASFISTDE